MIIGSINASNAAKSKEALNIEGLGKKVIDQFWDLRIIQEPSDIFNLDFKKIDKLEGWGALSINNLKKSIVKSKKINLSKFVYSIGIRHIGQENAKILAGFFTGIGITTRIPLVFIPFLFTLMIVAEECLKNKKIIIRGPTIHHIENLP